MNILKTAFAAFFVVVSFTLTAQNVKVLFSEKEYQLEEKPVGVPMFTYPLLVFNTGNVLSVTSYEKKYLRYVYLNKDGKELHSGKVDFQKYPKYSAYIYKFIVHDNRITAYSIVQEEIDKKNADVLYRFVIDMNTNKVITEEVVTTRSLSGNKFGTLTVFPDDNNESVTVFNCGRPEKNKFTFNITVFDSKNEKVIQSELEYINDDLKGMSMSIHAAKYISDKLFICTMEAVNKTFDKTVVINLLVNIKNKKAVLKELNFGDIISAKSVITYNSNQQKLNLNYAIVTNEKTNYLTDVIKKYYRFTMVPIDVETCVYSEPYNLSTQKINDWLSQKDNSKNYAPKEHMFPINFLMLPDGNEAVLTSNSFKGISNGDDMVPTGYYYKDPDPYYLNPSIIGSFCIDNKGREKEICYGNDVNVSSHYMYDLISSKNGYYIMSEEPEISSAAVVDPLHHYSAIHVANDGKLTKINFSQYPDNIVENIVRIEKTAPVRNPPGEDGFDTSYNRNNDRNIVSYMLKNKDNNKYRYAWIYFE